MSLNPSSDPDGSNPTGGVAAWLDDYTASGPVVCVRIVDNRAVVGFDTSEGVFLVYVYDNGPSGDSFDIVGWSGPANQCPVPPPGPYVTFSNFGDVVLTDRQ